MLRILGVGSSSCTFTAAVGAWMDYTQCSVCFAESAACTRASYPTALSAIAAARVHIVSVGKNLFAGVLLATDW